MQAQLYYHHFDDLRRATAGIQHLLNNNTKPAKIEVKLAAIVTCAHNVTEE